MLQAASDVLLGWGTDEFDGAHYYVRQLWDAKWSADVSTMEPSAFDQYAGHCGWALARAHARTGDSVTISGYIGTSDRFGEAIADWAAAYADQTERDHAALVAAIDRGVLPVAESDWRRGLLPAEHCGARDPADRRPGGKRRDRRPRRASDARPARHPPRDGRRRSGCAARPRRPAPRVRAVDGGRQVRGAASARRAGGQRHRHHLPARPAAGRTRSAAGPRSCSRTTPTPPSRSPMPCPTPGSTEQRWRTSRNCRASCGRCHRCRDGRPGRDRSAALHRDAERHVRHPHVEGGVARQPRADTGDGAARVRQTRSPSGSWRSTSPCWARAWRHR